jgi:hypothetical protein
MAGLDDRFDVVIDATIWKLLPDGTRQKEADGSDKIFTQYPLYYHDMPLLLMNRLQRAIAEVLCDLGDEGVVMMGGDEAAAVLEKMRGVKEKAKGSKK